MSTQPTSSDVRGRCACGKRYRIRGAKPGTTVQCPACQRPITISDIDLQAAGSDVALQAAQAADQLELRQAISIDHGELVNAPAGSTVGLTGATVLDSEDAVMQHALRGWKSSLGSTDKKLPNIGDWLDAREPVPRTLTGDLLASFYFAGSRRNAILIAISAMLMSLLSFGLILPALSVNLITIVLMVIGLACFGLVLASVLRFYSSVLVLTAMGDDEIPLTDPDWDFIDAVLWPLAMVILITLICSFPLIVVEYYLPKSAENRVLFQLGAGLVGSLFWPVAVMSVLVGGSILYLRPDWLLSSIFRMGPGYLLAWGTVVLVIAVWIGTWYAFRELLDMWKYSIYLFPLWFLSVNLYFGYVLFRTLGLVYRHFGERLPRRIA